MKTIKVGWCLDNLGGEQLEVDVTRLLDTRLLVTGNSGAGKSRLFRVIAEQAFGKAQIVVIDPEGEFPTLRERHDYLLVGPGGEVSADPRSAALLARRLLELRTSAVIDLSDLKLHERRSHVRQFLESLVDNSRSQGMLVMIDEAHLFCPEKDQDAESGAAVIDLMSRGRKRGLAGCLASQRLSKVNKDAAAEAKNVVVGGITVDVDLKRAGAILGMGQKEWLQLRDMPTGEFKAFGPAFVDVRGVVHFRAATPQTTHPTPGNRAKVAAVAAPDAIRKLAAELADLPQQAEEEVRTLRAAQARIKDLERELKAGPKPAPAKAGKPVEVLSPAALKRLEAALSRIDKDTSRLEASRVHLDGAIAGVGTERDRLAQAQQVVMAELAEVRAAVGRIGQATEIRPVAQAAATRQVVVSRAPVAARASSGDPSIGASGLRRILVALAQRPQGLTHRQIGARAVIVTRGGTFGTYMSKARVSGWITTNSAGVVRLTDAGLLALGHYDIPPTGKALQERWLGELGASGAGRMLRALIARYPGAMTHEMLGEAAGISTAGGTFGTYLSKLRTLELVTGKSEVKASDELFD